ncbi:hypothetical protein CARUB_v10024728mg, partial [Capsella rubella]
MIVSLFGLHQCRPYDRDNPKGIERCFHKFMGAIWSLEFLCCVEDYEICFPIIEPENCLKQCPPLQKRDAPSPSP